MARGLVKEVFLASNGKAQQIIFMLEDDSAFYQNVHKIQELENTVSDLKRRLDRAESALMNLVSGDYFD